MPKENDLEGLQDQSGKYGGQAGMPKPEQSSLDKNQDKREPPYAKDNCQSTDQGQWPKIGHSQIENGGLTLPRLGPIAFAVRD